MESVIFVELFAAFCVGLNLGFLLLKCLIDKEYTRYTKRTHNAK